MPATHVVYDANQDGYTVLLMNGGEVVDSYEAGNSPCDSAGWVENGLSGETLEVYAEQTAKEIAEENGLPASSVSRDEDLLT